MDNGRKALAHIIGLGKLKQCVNDGLPTILYYDTSAGRLGNLEKNLYRMLHSTPRNTVTLAP